MNIQYPKAEMLIVLGTKNYPVYTDLSFDQITDIKNSATRDEDIPFQIAKKKDGSFWYPSCGEDLVWGKALFNKRTIKAVLEVPMPKVKFDYSNSDYSNPEDIPF